MYLSLKSQLFYVVSYRVLYNQLRQVDDCINRDQLNEVLCFTLQILFGVLNERLESVNALREKINE